MVTIFHIAREAEWAAAEAFGGYPVAAEDHTDGFIHFSTASQVRESAAKHHAGETGLILLAYEAETLGPNLKWEPSRCGELFPHLYGEIPKAAILWTRPLPLDKNGRHVFPDTI